MRGEKQREKWRKKRKVGKDGGTKPGILKKIKGCQGRNNVICIRQYRHHGPLQEVSFYMPKI